MILIGVNTYLLIYVFKMVRFLKEFYNAIGCCKGETISEEDIENIKIRKGEIVKTSVPIYQFVLNGKNIKFKSQVRYRNLELGEKVNIVFDEEKGLFWCERDIQVLKRNLIIKILMMEFLLSVMVIVDLLL